MVSANTFSNKFLQTKFLRLEESLRLESSGGEESLSSDLLCLAGTSGFEVVRRLGPPKSASTHVLRVQPDPEKKSVGTGPSLLSTPHPTIGRRASDTR